MKGMKSRTVADEVWSRYREGIEEVWHTLGTDKSFNEFRKLVCNTIETDYSKKTLEKCSNVFIGYCAHYIYSDCVSFFGKQNGAAPVERWLTVDELGTEKIWCYHGENSRPHRLSGYPGKWTHGCCEANSVVLPRGTIKKLLGKKMTWQDEPVVFTIENNKAVIKYV